MPIQFPTKRDKTQAARRDVIIAINAKSKRRKRRRKKYYNRSIFDFFRQPLFIVIVGLLIGSVFYTKFRPMPSFSWKNKEFRMIRGINSNPYLEEAFYYTTTGNIEYEVWDTSALHGIMLSSDSGLTDFDALINNYQSVMIRVVTRGLTGNLATADITSSMYIEQAYYNNMEWGVYVEGKAFTPTEARNEAEIAISGLHGFTGKKVLYIWNGLSVGEYVTDTILEFCRIIEESGNIPVIGLDCFLAYEVFNLEKLKSYQWWIISEEDAMKFVYSYDFLTYIDNSTGYKCYLNMTPVQNIKTFR